MTNETLLREPNIHTPHSSSRIDDGACGNLIEPPRLARFAELVRALAENGIRYCHWKSNIALRKSMLGETDIDLLVHRADAGRFRSILRQLAFSNAFTIATRPFPSVEHYYGLDEENGVLMHVHSYYQVITGESLTKNYCFPFEEMLFTNSRELYGVPMPSRGAELVTFTLRMMLKHTTATELLLLSRYWKNVRVEARWLADAESLREAISLAERWLPELDTDLFAACVAALSRPAPLLERVLLGRRLRAQLRTYARHSGLRSWFDGLRKFTTLFFWRLAESRKDMMPRDGGVIVAFVGSEATGKSTLIAEMEDWLGAHFSVEKIHAGKPGSTVLSALPNMILPILRGALPKHRSTFVENRNAGKGASMNPQRAYPLLFVIRSVLLAYDRRALLRRAVGSARKGTIVLCDRYPSSTAGAPDSPQLGRLMESKDGGQLRSWLAALESNLYREIPAPDLVIRLSAPLEITLLRNAARSKSEPEEYVRQRHARSSVLQFEGAQVFELDTQKPMKQTILEAKAIIWSLFLRDGCHDRQT